MLDRVKDALTDDQALPASLDEERSPRRSRGATIARGALQAVVMLGILAGSGLLMQRLIDSRPEPRGRPAFSAALPVDAVVADISTQQPMVRLYGEVVAGKTVELRTAVSGEVLEISPKLAAGRSVDDGDVLFRIDQFDYETALAEAEASLAQQRAAIVENRARITAEREQLVAAEEQLSFALSDAERAQSLRANGTLTQRQVDDRNLIVSQRRQAVTQRSNNLAIEEARLQGQLATQRRLELGVERARRNLAETTVIAPFAGTIRTTTIEVGRIVSANDIAVSMYDGEALDVAFTLSDAQYGRIATDADPLIGRNVDVAWTVGTQTYEYTAEVDRLGADIASDRGGVTVFARLDPSSAEIDIRPGAFVELIVPDRTYEEAVRLPDTALYGASRVYVIADGRLESRDVTVVGFDENDVILSSGVSNGERVLTTRLAEVDEGLQVTVPSLDGDRAPGRAANR
ncbi:MAG: HlyD family efflux transporter periplasmic adaptor subunit [Pseudomonadota bacterium]